MMTGYLTVNMLLALAYGLARVARLRSLRAQRALIVAALALPWLAGALPASGGLRHSAQVFTEFSARMSSFADRANAGAVPWPGIADRAFAALAAREARALAAQWVSGLGPALALLVALIATILLGHLVFRLARLKRSLERLPEARRIGRVSLRVAEDRDVAVPFAAWLGRRAYIVVPQSIVDGVPARDFLLIIRHELQHHRSRDTHFSLVLEALKALCFWNPAAHAWASRLGEHQEFACDAALIGRRKVAPRAYGHCLVRVAELARSSRRPLAGTTSLAARGSGSLLKRRIEHMIEVSRLRGGRSKWIGRMAALGTFAVMASVAVMARGAELGSADRALTAAEAQKLALQASSGSEIPIAMNELVLAELNRYIGTPNGRQSVHEALGRMAQYRAMLEKTADAYSQPADLLAVPIHESRYENVSWSPGAGLWGFIRTTARHYQLVVNDQVDERLDEAKETGAAMRYFRDLFNIFHDWRLALRAYNEGESHVMKIIKKHGTRDAWELERLEPSREHYLASVTALLIIMKNPALVD